MKKAFSMIEMIFVIAVIGILSAVAIPKLMANRETAHIVKLKEQIEAIRKGIEAYAGNQYLETGVKKYPSKLCSSGCKGASVFADNVANGIVRRAANSVGWDNFDDDLLFVIKPKEKIGFFFNYDDTTGTFKCDTSKVKNGWKAEKCSALGE